MESYVEVVGIAIQTAIFIFGGIGMVIRNDSATKTLNKDMIAMREELKGLAQVITAQAVHDERLNEQSRRMTILEQKIEELRHGKGFVRSRNPSDPHENGVDGEY